jgi:ribosomal protein S18 acetylase RimI-like enzyme
MKSSDKETVDIRRMARGDIDAVLAIDRKIGGGRGLITYRDMVAVDPGGAFDLSFVAEIDRQVVGFILARLTYVGVPFMEIALIHALAVDPGHQKHGIATKLVNALLSHCHSEGVSTVRAVLVERNTELRRFFERLGFHRSELINYTRTFEG